MIPRPLSSLRAADVLSPFEAGSCEVPVTYCGGTYHVAKGHDAKGGFYYTVRGDEWSGYRIARSLPAVRKLIWDAQA